MLLKGKPDCDVKYFVITPETSYGDKIGILVRSHSDNEKWRKPMVDFLREKWAEFQYEP